MRFPPAAHHGQREAGDRKAHNTRRAVLISINSSPIRGQARSASPWSSLAGFSAGLDGDASGRPSRATGSRRADPIGYQ